jgi:hypothetical protein
MHFPIGLWAQDCFSACLFTIEIGRHFFFPAIHIWLFEYLRRGMTLKVPPFSPIDCKVSVLSPW